MGLKNVQPKNEGFVLCAIIQLCNVNERHWSDESRLYLQQYVGVRSLSSDIHRNPKHTMSCCLTAEVIQVSSFFKESLKETFDEFGSTVSVVYCLSFIVIWLTDYKPDKVPTWCLQAWCCRPATSGDPEETLSLPWQQQAESAPVYF